MFDLKASFIEHITLALLHAYVPFDLRRLDEVKANSVNGVIDSGFIAGLLQSSEVSMVEFIDHRVRNAQSVVAHSIEVNVILLEVKDTSRSNDEELSTDFLAHSQVNVLHCLFVNASSELFNVI